MWDDNEDNLRTALRAELAGENPPPARGGLPDVVGRGRRRRRTQQLGAALAVVAAFGGTAVAAATLDGTETVTPAGRLETTTSVVSTSAASAEADWPRAELPARAPDGTWAPGETAPPPSGRAVISKPQCSIPDTTDRAWGTVRAAAEVRSTVADALATAAGGADVGELVERHYPSSRPGAVDTYDYVADVTDAGGTGSVAFSVGRFDGDPLAAADQQAFDEFNCEPPKRQVLPGGAVVQLYALQPSDPFQSLTQTARIYLPDGQMYMLAVRNFGSPDFAPNPSQPEDPERVRAGRETLPLSERQLADLAETIAQD
ncbi:hypothetical protein [Actinophytocola xanthii]|uniref:hypothetical protein n=1 Tax=Actinophytocola xanthii TaxID=1912961 RepID=UPI000A94FA88|nr:hypothetical protein [Actinophytocola xanthii]